MKEFAAGDFSDDRLASLREEYGAGKQLLKGAELPCLIALSYFPELKRCRIRFGERPIRSTMVTLMTAGSLFRRRSRRQYLIFANSRRSRSGIGVLFGEVPFNAQVGLVGHELAHVADYEKRNFFSLCALAVGYLFPRPRRRYEKETDLDTIRHGLGRPLWAQNEFIMRDPSMPPEYRAFLKKYYMTSDEMMATITAAGE